MCYARIRIATTAAIIEGAIVIDIAAAAGATAAAATAATTGATTAGTIAVITIDSLFLSPLPQIRVAFTMGEPHFAHHDVRDDNRGRGQQRETARNGSFNCHLLPCHVGV